VSFGRCAIGVAGAVMLTTMSSSVSTTALIRTVICPCGMTKRWHRLPYASTYSVMRTRGSKS
jgi:hypothetical protein